MVKNLNQDDYNKITGGPPITRVLITRFLITRVLKRVLKNSVNTIFFSNSSLSAMLLIGLQILNCQPQYNVSTLFIVYTRLSSVEISVVFSVMLFSFSTHDTIQHYLTLFNTEKKFVCPFLAFINGIFNFFWLNCLIQVLQIHEIN